MKRCISCDALHADASWYCSKCGFRPEMGNGFPAFAPDLDLQDHEYDPSIYAKLATLEQNNFWFRSRNRLIQSASIKYAATARNILEIGCGSGFVLQGLRETFPAAVFTASDIHCNGLEVAAHRNGKDVRFLQMDARVIPFRDEFDLVGSFDVIEHIDDDEAVLKEVRAALRPGGILILTVPQHMWLWSPSDTAARHKRRYEKPDLMRKFATAGFEALFATSFVSLLLPAMMAARWNDRRRGDYDLEREFGIPSFVNRSFGAVCAVERFLIGMGITFPVGGSLLVVARRVP